MRKSVLADQYPAVDLITDPSQGSPSPSGGCSHGRPSDVPDSQEPARDRRRSGRSACRRRHLGTDPRLSLRGHRVRARRHRGGAFRASATGGCSFRSCVLSPYLAEAGLPFFRGSGPCSGELTEGSTRYVLAELSGDVDAVPGMLAGLADFGQVMPYTFAVYLAPAGVIATPGEPGGRRDHESRCSRGRRGPSDQGREGKRWRPRRVRRRDRDGQRRIDDRYLGPTSVLKGSKAIPGRPCGAPPRSENNSVTSEATACAMLAS
jgi:hypothetical protein